ncbi:MAG: hypothetical protein B7Y41_08085 [Hydrogenophilales bacterium 28-61-23]|nr:MAG: hypothetical protein B7Y41_08085 [Hydrogenophilales bacterium 28-61-23]
MNLAAWIASLVPSLVGRVLAALGMGLITIGGLTVISTQLLAYITSSIGGMPADILGLLGLAGLGDALNIVVGAITARLSLYALTQSSKVIGTAS